jgi:hypothetical protein
LFPVESSTGTHLLKISVITKNRFVRLYYSYIITKKVNLPPRPKGREGKFTENFLLAFERQKTTAYMYSGLRHSGMTTKANGKQQRKTAGAERNFVPRNSVPRDFVPRDLVSKVQHDG